MTTGFVYPQGSQTVEVAAGNKIAVFSEAAAKVYQQVGYPNFPDSWNLLYTTLPGVQYTSAAFSAGATLRIDAGPAMVQYETAAAPNTEAQLTLQAPVTSTQIAALSTVTVPTLTTTDLPTLTTTQIGQFNTLMISANTAADVLNGLTANS